MPRQTAGKFATREDPFRRAVQTENHLVRTAPRGRSEVYILRRTRADISSGGNAFLGVSNQVAIDELRTSKPGIWAVRAGRLIRV